MCVFKVWFEQQIKMMTKRKESTEGNFAVVQERNDGGLNLSSSGSGVKGTSSLKRCLREARVCSNCHNLVFTGWWRINLYKGTLEWSRQSIFVGSGRVPGIGKRISLGHVEFELLCIDLVCLNFNYVNTRIGIFRQQNKRMPYSFFDSILMLYYTGKKHTQFPNSWERLGALFLLGVFF